MRVSERAFVALGFKFDLLRLRNVVSDVSVCLCLRRETGEVVLALGVGYA